MDSSGFVEGEAWRARWISLTSQVASYPAVGPDFQPARLRQREVSQRPSARKLHSPFRNVKQSSPSIASLGSRRSAKALTNPVRNSSDVASLRSASSYIAL